MARLYVNLELMDGTDVVTFGTSNIKEAYDKFNMLFEQLTIVKVSPCVHYKIKDYDGATLRLCVRRNKKVRLHKTISLKDDIYG